MQPQGYVPGQETFLDKLRGHKVNNWLLENVQVASGQVGQTTLGDGHAPMTSSSAGLGADALAIQGWSTMNASSGVADVLTSAVQGHDTGAEKRVLGLSAPSNVKQSFTLMPPPPSSEITRPVNYSYLEHVAGADKNAVYSSNVAGVNPVVGLRQINQHGLLVDRPAALPPMGPPQGPVPAPHVAQNDRGMHQPAPHVLQQNAPEQQNPGALEQDQDGESTASDSSRNSRKSVKKVKKKKIKSGFLDKPDTNVMSKVLVPHMAQSGLFMHKPYNF